MYYRMQRKDEQNFHSPIDAKLVAHNGVPYAQRYHNRSIPYPTSSLLNPSMIKDMTLALSFAVPINFTFGICLNKLVA